MPEHRRPDGPASSGSAAAMRLALERVLAGDANRDEASPPSIADHVLLRRIGRGAYGDVWLARSALGTLRAVKIVFRSRFQEDRPYEREFNGILRYEPVSRTHEGVVHVLHVGRNDEVGCFYYVMELADAAEPTNAAAPGAEPVIDPSRLDDYAPRTLRSDLAAHRRLPAHAAAQLGVRLAGALAHLHDNGLVHRDIKPANVIFVGGQPKLADIGLVTDVGSSQSFVGTEGFIPPEGPGTPRGDLYGLGKLLYEAATGCDRMEFPHLPAEATQLPEGEGLLELNEVITRACAPDPDRRYASATELEADLNLFLAGRSLRRMRNIERYLDRARKLAAAACLFFLVTALALWLVKAQERRATEHARTESALRQRAEAAEQQAQQQLFAALLEQARATVRSGEVGQRFRALAAVRRAAGISNSPALRREAIAALALPDLRFEQEVRLPRDFTAAQIAPQFDRFAVCRGRRAVEIRSVRDGSMIATLPPGTNLMCYSVLWSEDGRFLAVNRDHDNSGRRCEIEVWDLRGTPRRVLMVANGRYKSRAFHPSRPEFLAVQGDGTIAAWDLETAKELQRSAIAAVPVRILYSPDGTRVAASWQLDERWCVSVHDVANGSVIASNVFSGAVVAFDWHPTGRSLAVPDYDGGVHIMDAQSGRVRQLGRHKAEAVKAAFHAGGRYLISGAWGRELICWDVVRGQKAFTIEEESYTPQFSADGQACAFLTISGMRIYAFEPPSAHRELNEEFAPRSRHAAFSPDGRWLAASSDERLSVWNLASGGPGAFTNDAPETRVYWSADGKELFGSGGRNQECYRWRVHPGASTSAPPVLERLPILRPSGFASLSVMSNQLAWTSARGSQVTSIDASAPDESAWAPTDFGVNGTSPDGQWFVVYRSFTPFMSVYRLPDFQRVARLTNQARISGFSFTPSGEELAVVSRGQIEFWSTRTWERTRLVTNVVGIGYRGAIFHPDGRSLWLARGLRKAGLHDAKTFEPLLFLPDGMFPLALSGDGRKLAVSLDGRRLQVWDLAEVRSRLAELGLDWSKD